MDLLTRWALFLLAAVLLSLLLERKAEREPYIRLKFVFYACLGAVSFPVNEIQLPLGIIVFLVVLHPKINSGKKRYMALFGFLFFLIQLFILPLDTLTVREETQEIGRVKVTDGSYDRLFDKIEQRIGDESLRLEEIDLLFDRGGGLRSAEIEVIARGESRYLKYDVTYKELSGTLTYQPREEIAVRSLSAYYQKLIDANEAFKTFKRLDTKQVLRSSPTPYIRLESGGLYETFSLQDEKVMLIDKKGGLIPYVNTGEDVLANAIRIKNVKADGQTLRTNEVLLYNYSFETSRRKGVTR